MNRRKFLKVCSVPASVSICIPQVSVADKLNNSGLTEEQKGVHQYKEFTRFRRLGDNCLENFVEEISFSGQKTITSPDGSPYYVPKVIVSDIYLKTVFEQQEAIKGLDYIFDGIRTPFDENLIKNQFYFTDMLYLPIEVADQEKVNRMLQVFNAVKNTRTRVVIIAILPLRWDGDQKHEISGLTIDKLNSLGVSYILIPPNIPKLSHYEAKLYINRLVVQSVRAPTELVTCMGMPSGTSCAIDPILSMKGHATMGIGTSGGNDRATEATINALKSPSFDLIGLTKASSVLINITTGKDYSIHEYEDVCKTISSLLPQEPSPEVCAFSVIKPEINNKMDVTILATGINNTI